MKYRQKLIIAHSSKNENELLDLVKNETDIYIVANIASNKSADLKTLHYLYENFEAHYLVYKNIANNKNSDSELLKLLAIKIIKEDELHNQDIFFTDLLRNEKVNADVLKIVLDETIFYFSEELILSFLSNKNINDEIAAKLSRKVNLNIKMKTKLIKNKSVSNGFLKSFVFKNESDLKDDDFENALISRKLLVYDDSYLRLIRVA